MWKRDLKGGVGRGLGVGTPLPLAYRTPVLDLRLGGVHNQRIALVEAILYLRNTHRIAFVFCPAPSVAKTFKEVGGYDDIVLVKDIPFASHCEHHMVPFFGKAHISYLPSDGVVGLSKLARLVEVYARRLQVQENMTQQVIDAVNEHLDPRGAAVMIEAEHMCMSIRGVRAHGAQTSTLRFTGMFAEERDLQDRFFAMVNRRG